RVVSTTGNTRCVVGDAGPGTLRVRDDALVVVTGEMTIGGSIATAPGLVELGTDTLLSVSRDLVVGNTGPGTLALISPTSEVTVLRDLVIRAAGAVTGVGALDVDGTVIVNAGGSIAPGLSPGVLTINGNLQLEQGSMLRMEIAGLAPTQTDLLRVSGNASLNGELQVRFLDGFLPRTRDAFEFIEIDGTHAGSFERVEFPDLDPAFNAELRSVDGKLTLTALSNALPGSGATISGDIITAPPPFLPPCGTGLCGAGMVNLLPLTLAGMMTIRRRASRSLQTVQRPCLATRPRR
ncbi:MAG: autotransporter outer membrane beta-barrel domain-containing protein, partial [Phycisphaerae bacterium]